MKKSNKFLVGIIAMALAGFGVQTSYAQEAITTDTASSSLDNVATSQDSGANFDAVVTQGESQISLNPSDTVDQESVLVDEVTAVAETDGNLPPVEVEATDELDIPEESPPETTLETTIDQLNADNGDSQSQVDQSTQDSNSVDTSSADSSGQ
jgi:hypothetical protein